MFKTCLHYGWKWLWQHPLLFMTLCAYQIIWGVVLYRYISHLIDPILVRIPDQQPGPDALQIFLIEAQFRLTKTDLAHTALWFLAIIVLIRLLLTPLIQAIVFHRLIDEEQRAGESFLVAIRRFALPFTFFFIAYALLLFAPLGLLLPKMFSNLLASPTLLTLLTSVVPWLFAWIIYAIILRYVLLWLLFGYMDAEGIVRPLTTLAKQLGLAIGVSLIVFLLFAVSYIALSSAAFVWVGLGALILHQSLHLLKIGARLLETAALHRLWQAHKH